MSGYGDSGECPASEMNAALGRYNEFIDLRIPEVFDIWHGTPGLRCMVCRNPVTAYRSRAHNPFVRHGKGSGAARNSPAARASANETFLHNRCKYWVRDELRRCGVADAEVETPVGNRRPDVLGHYRGEGFAVEVQWSPLGKDTAQARTDELRDAGVDNVLWLTRSCNWVELLPALAITDFHTSDDYGIHSGWLTMRPNTGLRLEKTSVRQVLHQWVNGELAWAYRDHKRAGWATVTNWQKHTQRQAVTIEALQHKLTAAGTQRDDLTSELTATRSQVEQAHQQRDDYRQRYQQSCSEIETLEARLRDTAATLATRTTILKLLITVCIALALTAWLT